MPAPYYGPTRAGVSESLDTLARDIGAILVRGPHGWQAILPGPPGYVLTSMGPNALPEWRPPP